MYIYVLENKNTGKMYVGRSSNPEQRFRVHKSNAKRHCKGILYDAIREYGMESFELRILEQVKPEEKVIKEDYWIQKLNSKYPYGYNKVFNARYKEENSFFGKKHSEEVRKRISNSATGRRIESKHISIACYDKKENLIRQFEAKIDAWKWLFETEQTTNKSSRSVTTQINDSIKRGTKSFGYYWKLTEKV